MAQRRALTELVQEHVGLGRRWSVRAFAERAVDPETGYQLGKSLIGKIAKGETFTVSPELIRALAAGLDVPLERVQAAGAQQFIGVTVSAIETEGGVVRVAHDPGTRPQEAPLASAFIDSVLGKDDPADG